jgi:hypothetical protein
VSVLEGGYNINGGLVSAFARSVEAHVRGLAEPHAQVSLGPARQQPASTCTRGWLCLGTSRADATLHLPVKACACTPAASPQVWDPEDGRIEREQERKRNEERAARIAAKKAAAQERLRRLEAAAAAAVAAGAAGEGGSGAAAAGVAAEGGEAAAGGRSKRRRTSAAVDYAALNAELEAAAAGKPAGEPAP